MNHFNEIGIRSNARLSLLRQRASCSKLATDRYSFVPFLNMGADQSRPSHFIAKSSETKWRRFPWRPCGFDCVMMDSAFSI